MAAACLSTSSTGAGLYGSPSSQSGGVAAIIMGESCDDVLEAPGDMWCGACVDPKECVDRSDDAGECEWDIRLCWFTREDAPAPSAVHA